MSRPRRFKTVKQMEKAWEEYKAYCDNQEIIAHGFSAKNSELVTQKLHKRITYTLEGFCVYARIARAAFYSEYADNPIFSDMVTRMREECELDARTKFETGEIPSQLAGLWMSRHGYTTKSDNNVTGGLPVVIVDDLE